MPAPSITTKTWTGAAGERFTYADFNRIASNTNVLLAYYGLDPISVATVDRSSVFSHRDAQKIEDAVALMAGMLHIDHTETAWGPGVPLSFRIFNEWEMTLKAIQEKGDDGKHTLFFKSPGAPLGWSLETSGETVLASGGTLGDMAFRLSAGNYALRMAGYGDVVTVSVGLTGNTRIDLSEQHCTVKVSCSRPIVALQYNGYEVDGIQGTAGSFIVLRTSNSRLITSELLNDAPSYSGVSTDLLWRQVAQATMTPNVASKSVTLVPERDGIVVEMIRAGTLAVPRTGKYDMIAIGGGSSGHPEGPGGCSGNVTWLKSVSVTKGDYSVVIGAGGVHTETGDGRYGGTTSLGSLISAEGGTYDRGCAGGGAGGTINGRSGRFGGGGGGARGSGGSGGTYGGDGGYRDEDGQDGTTLSDPLVCTRSRSSAGGTPYSSGSGGGGGGGGLNAPGGKGGYGFLKDGGGTLSGGGGGGGGVDGSTGGSGSPNTGRHSSQGGRGSGYGAGGGGHRTNDNIHGAGGGGGGMGVAPFGNPADLADYLAGHERDGRHGAVRIRWVGD